MASEQKLGGTFTFPATKLTVNRMGYGAMQLAGPHVFGPPKDRAAAVALLRTAVEAGVNHIDTSDFYGPYVTNEIIREALHPYPAGLVIVTKLGARRGHAGAWFPWNKPQDLIAGVESNLKNLGLEALDVVNLRLMPSKVPLAEQVGALLDLQEQGLIREIGVSNVTAEEIAEAQGLAEIVCVQNEYNLVKRDDDALIADLARQGIAYVPFFPLGGFTPLQHAELDAVAAEIGKTPMQVALAWLLQRSPNVLLIPGTSSLGHLRENLAAAEIVLPPEIVARLDAIGVA